MSKPAFTVRASSWETLFDCSLRWFETNVNGVRRPSSPEAHLGTAVHASTAFYDKARLEGQAVTPDDAAQVLVDTIHRPEEDVAWRRDRGAKESERIGLQLHTRYCAKIATEHHYTQVEARLTPMPVETDDAIITLTGTLDRLYAEGELVRGVGLTGKFGVLDVKTGGRLVNKEGKVNVQARGAQGGVYELLAEHTFGYPINLPYRIGALSTSGTGATGVADIPNARSILIGRDDSPGLLDIAGKLMRAGVFPPNPRSLFCSPKYCPAWDKCIYHE
jgi:hypothetical protein